jgi:integrase
MAKGRKTETEPIKWSKAMMLLDAMRDSNQDNTRLMLACGFFFGLRISDILSLKWEHIMQDEFVLEEKKTGKQRHISLDPKFKEIRSQVLDNLGVQPMNFIFTFQRADGDQDSPISVVAANKRIKKVFEEYDIQCKNPSSHTLRKTFGLRIYEVYNRCEDSLILLSQIFNHQDISVTRRYIGITQRRISNAYLSLSSGKPKFD